jgi:hypothetical protein
LIDHAKLSSKRSARPSCDKIDTRARVDIELQYVIIAKF